MAGNVVEFTDSNFKSQVLDAEQTVLVDFWATWCAPCRAIAPSVEALANEYAGKAVVGKLDTDANQETAAAYGIRSIPTLLVFKGGKVVDQIIGGVPKAAIENVLKKHLS